LIVDLENNRERLYTRLDQYLKLQIQKRGISIIHNTYTGFDTEYEFKAKLKNKLISVQTAVQRRSIVKIPIKQPFDLSYVNPLTSEISQTYSNKVTKVNPHKNNFIEEFGSNLLLPDKSGGERLKLNELFTLNNSIMLTVTEIRVCLYKNVDDFNTKLIKKLIELKGTVGF
jgi:hypothetical protein